MSVQHATSCYGVGENGVPRLSQKVTDTHSYTQTPTAEKIDTKYCGLHCDCRQG